MARLRYQSFGGLEVLGPAGRVDLGTRKQRAVLAVLLLEEGRPVSVDRLVEDVWSGAPPQRAEASLHAYVSTLRRVLEPDRKPRQPAEVLVRRGNGYALLVPTEDVDFRTFAQQVERARRAHAAGDLATAGAALDDALGCYAPLLPEFDGEPWSDPDRLRLSRLHRAAVRLSYDVRLHRGEHRLLEPELRAAAQAEPLDEDLWAMLALALYRSDRQGEALQAVAECKRALADQLGVDPGPRLRRLEHDLLAQAPELAGPPDAPPSAATLPVQRPQPTVADDAPPVAVAPPAAAPADAAGRVAPETVGRVPELAALVEVVGRAAQRRHGVAVVEAEAGAGKTHLLGAAAQHAERHGAQVVWGRCSHGSGAPALWPWVQVTGALRAGHEAVAEDDDPELVSLLAPGISGGAAPAVAADPGATFRQSEALVRLVQRASRSGPLVVVLDDVHWADEASLGLLEHLATRLPPGTALLVGLRPAAAHTSPRLAQALAALARTPHHERLQLGPLPVEGVATVVEQETGYRPDDDTAAAIHARTGGNAFFAREVARLLHRTGRLGAADLGPVDVGSEVPVSVLDVVRGRLAALPEATAGLLRLAAVAGREIDLAVLARAAGGTVAETYERLGPAVEDGVLVAHPQRAGWWRFGHDLVRDAVVGTTPPLTAPQLHLQVADALEAVHPETAAEPLAYHLWSAGPLADPSRTACALVRASRMALAKHAHAAAQQHLELAAGVARSAGLDELELEALTALTAVASARVGYAGGDPAWFVRGEELARRLDRPRAVGHLLFARWAAASQALRLDDSAAYVQALQEFVAGHDDPVLDLYAGLAAGIDHWDRGRIGDSHRRLEQALEVARVHRDLVRNDVMRFDLELLLPAFVGVVRAMHGDVEGARAMLGELEQGAAGDPYRGVIWGQFAAITESIIGDVDRTLEVTRRGLEADPDGSFPFLGTLILVEYWWAVALLAMRDGAPDAAEEAAHACHELAQVVADIRRTGTVTGDPGNVMLLAEALLVSGDLDAAAAALGEAQASMEQHGQRADEPLVLLVTARLQQARGESEQSVLATVERARRLAAEREAYLFVRQAERFAAELSAPGAAPTSLATA